MQDAAASPSSIMNRRDFTRVLVLTALAAERCLPQASSDAVLEVDAEAAPTPVAVDFTGLSYESAQLANPAFFSASNKPLIQIFSELTPHGVLRLGGGSSGFTEYSDTPPAGSPPFEVFGPDTSKTVKTGTITSSLALENLRKFLDAVNWSCLYGLNLARGTKENAAREAASVHRILGRRLMALQIGNEPDSFRKRYRPADYAPADFMKEWNQFHRAIVAVVPQAKFAGPDTSNKLPFFLAFADEAPQHPDVILLTAHAYAMGPAGSPNATLDKLLNDDPSVQTQPDKDLDVILASAKKDHLPYRMCEGNSCWDGGKPGVSDTLASALWCGDYMLHLAQKGVAGVNMHGGGNGYYTPIAGAPSTGFTRRPEYFGMQLAQCFAGANLLQSKLTTANARLTAYVAQHDRTLQVAVFNKSAETAAVLLPALFTGRARHAEQRTLTGAAFDSKEVFFAAASRMPARLRRLEIPAHSSVLYRVEL
jgi:hypothetical protein